MVVDGTQEFHPEGLGGVPNGAFLGYFNGTISGIHSGEMEFTIISSSGIRTDSYPATLPLTFVYGLPETYMEGSHSLQLKIAGSATGLSFAVTPP